MSDSYYPPAGPLLIGYDPFCDLPADHLARLVEQVVEATVTGPPPPPRPGQPPCAPRPPLAARPRPAPFRSPPDAEGARLRLRHRHPLLPPNGAPLPGELALSLP